MRKSYEKFVDYIQKNGWQFCINEHENLKLNREITSRYSNICEEYLEFLRCFEKVVTPDQTAWFLCVPDYEEISESEDKFCFNEFEQISLDVAEGDSEWTQEITNFWDKTFPIILSTSYGYYSYYAIDLTDNSCKIVYGEEPEFEETEVVADCFEEFLGMIMRGEIVLGESDD